MSQTFACPNCGAKIEAAGSTTSVRCAYCDSIVPVAPEIKEAIQQAQVAQTSRTVGKYVIIFVVVIFVVPTCIGLCAALVGVLAPLVAIFFASLP